MLWQPLRNVRLWTCSKSEKHHFLFSNEATGKRHEQLSQLTENPELYAALAVIAELLANPVQVDRSRLTDACFNIAGWAEAHQPLGTAQEFMEGGALASLELARPAYQFAKAVTKYADYPFVESWFWRAIHLARRRQDWKVYALAWSGLGNLHVLRGNDPAAKRAHLRVYRAAKRHGLLKHWPLSVHLGR